MFNFEKKIVKIIFLSILFIQPSFSEEKNFIEIIETIQKDLKTLEKAVYSKSESSLEISTELSESSEDVLTRHLLKLSEIEGQFQKLTNKFEEINFKLDKLSNRLSKVQADNQMRFQQLENSSFSEIDKKKLSSKQKKNKKKFYLVHLKHKT